MSGRKDVAYSVWLMLAQPSQEQFRTVVADLAKAYDAPLFDPHVTLFVGFEGEREGREILASLAAAARPIMLNPVGLRSTELFHKTLFVQFESNAAAESIRAGCESMSLKPSDYSLDPHLSLIYQHLTDDQKQTLQQQVQIPAGPYHFDRIQLIEFRLPFGLDTVKDCKCVAEFPLLG
jgi:2'-5' RNA ligase